MPRESNRDRLIRRYGEAAVQHEQQPFVAMLGAGSNGVWETFVNSRETPRPAVASNEFAFTANGPAEGDHAILITAEGNDMPTVVGVSPWII